MFKITLLPVYAKCHNIYRSSFTPRRSVHVFDAAAQAATVSVLHECVVTHTYFSRTAWTSIPEEFHLQAGANESKHT